MTRLTRNLDSEADKPAAFFIWNGVSVNTEITNKTGSMLASGWLAYDATCGVCVRWITRVQGILLRRNIHVVQLQSPWVRRRLGLRDGEETDRMWLMLPDGRLLGGADALIDLIWRVGWARPLALFAGLPGMRGLLHGGYNWVARNRHCLGGTCSLTPHTTPAPRRVGMFGHAADLLPLFALPAVTSLTASHLRAWVFMWLLAFSIFLGCKWAMYRKAIRSGIDVTVKRTIAYFFAWPGLDARCFLDETKRPAAPTRSLWLFAVAKVVFGALLLWIATPRIPPNQPLLTGWVAMVGLIFLLHFGLFHLLTLAWRAAGVDAPIMMHNPVAARSLSEFWGKRWNRDFRVLAHELVFKPTFRTLGPQGAMFLVFLLSGLVHDLVISLPARAGWGLPTAYFLLQFAGILFEGSPLGKRLGLSRGKRGWLFTLIITAGPAFALFHPAFVMSIILPFARAIGAL